MPVLTHVDLNSMLPNLELEKLSAGNLNYYSLFPPSSALKMQSLAYIFMIIKKTNMKNSEI